MAPERSKRRRLGHGIVVGSVVAGGVCWLPPSWSWDVLGFALSCALSVAGVVVLVTGRSSQTCVSGFAATLAGIAALTLGWGSAAAFFIVVAGVVLPLLTAVAVLAPHIRSRRGSAECVEPLLACALGGVLAGILICGLQIPGAAGADGNWAGRLRERSGEELAGDVRRSGATASEPTERTRVQRPGSSDMTQFAAALSRQHEVALVLVTVLIACVCCGVWLTSGRWNRNQKGPVA